jgi:hypothetical protein
LLATYFTTNAGFGTGTRNLSKQETIGVER